VTNPEPPLLGSALYEMPNVQLSSHIAGVICNERRRLTDLVEAELARFFRGTPLQHAVSIEELERMA